MAKGIRYPEEKKQEVVDFVIAYNNEHNGRGGVANASKKFEIASLTIKAWYDKATGGVGNVSKSKALFKLGELQADIEKAEAELSKLQAKYDSYKEIAGL